MDFDIFLQKKLGQHDPSQIEELILDNIMGDDSIVSFTQNHKDSLEKYSNLTHLSLNSLGLQNLSNFPSLPNLKVLELENNALKGDDFQTIVELYPELYKLKLANNNITSLNALKPLNKSFVQKISIIGNPLIKNNKDYKEEIYKVVAKLRIVDGTDKNGQEIDTTDYEENEEEEEEEGEFDEEEGEELSDEEQIEKDDEDSGEENEESEEESEDEEINKERKKKK